MVRPNYQEGIAPNNVFKLASLFDYLYSLPNQVIFIPMLDPVGTVNPVVYNPSVAKGRNIVVNPDFASDTIWGKGVNWTISSGAANHAAGAATNLTQALPITVGVTYESIYDIINYIADVILIAVGNTGLGSTRNANGTYIQNIVCAGVPTLFFIAGFNFNGSVDNVSIKQLNIPQNSLTASALNALARGNWWSFDGTNDAINLYSNSLNSVLLLDEFTINIFAYPTSDDATLRRIIRFASSSGNMDVSIYRSGNTYVFLARINGVSSAVSIALNIMNKWNMLTLTASALAGEMKAYHNGLQVGATQSFVNNQNENLISTQAVLGAGTSTGAQSWVGNLRLAQVLNTALTPSEIYAIFLKSGY